MDREPPKSGECWRHYKLKDGVEYVANIVAIAQYSSVYFTDQEDAVLYGNLIEIINELGSYSSFIVKDTETEELLEVQKQSEQWILRPAISPLTNKATERKPVGWARSLSNFMDIVSFPYGDKASNCYRFERIE